MSKFLKEFGAFLQAWENEKLKPWERRLNESLHDFTRRLEILEAKFEVRNTFWNETQINTEDELKLFIKLLEVLREHTT